MNLYLNTEAQLEARRIEIRQIEKVAGWDFLDDRDDSTRYAADSGKYYAYVNRQKLLTARWLRGENDGWEG